MVGAVVVELAAAVAQDVPPTLEPLFRGLLMSCLSMGQG